MIDVALDQIDPELRGFLDVFPRLEIDRDTIEALRAKLAAGADRPSAFPVLTDEVVARNGDQQVRMLRFRKSDRSEQPVLLWMHGGGYVMGYAADERARRFAHELDCTVLSVDYRLAPEVPFPGALEDCQAALAWVHDQAGTLDIDPNRIVIGGASAGGGLAAGLALWNRDNINIPIRAQLLLYPMIDDRHDSAFATSTAFPIWTREASLNAWDIYLGTEDRSSVPEYAVPARHADLSNLPACHMFVGSEDLFCHEIVRYAERLNQASTSSALAIFTGMYHGGEAYVPQAAISQKMNRAILSSLRGAFA